MTAAASGKAARSSNKSIIRPPMSDPQSISRLCAKVKMAIIDPIESVALPCQGKGTKNQADIKAAGTQVMSVNRQQGDHNAYTGNGGKNRKEKCGEYFFINKTHAAFSRQKSAFSIRFDPAQEGLPAAGFRSLENLNG
jgi:hypothetical protein